MLNVNDNHVLLPVQWKHYNEVKAFADILKHNPRVEIHLRVLGPPKKKEKPKGLFARFEAWFNARFGWFFINGNKRFSHSQFN